MRRSNPTRTTDEEHNATTVEYIEGLSTDMRLPGQFVPEFRESPEEELATQIPQTFDPAIPKNARWPNVTLASYMYYNTNGDAGTDAPIPFGRANSVRVDNYTPQWCRVAGVYIAPATVGWVIALDRAVSMAKLTWGAPPGTTQPATVATAAVYHFWYEERFAPETGISVAVASSGGGGSGTVPTAGTATNTNVVSSGSSVTILAANANRKGASVYNDSTQILYLDLAGDTASTSNYTVQIGPQGFYELPPPAIYSGKITGIWASANGNARVTELT